MEQLARNFYRGCVKRVKEVRTYKLPVISHENIRYSMVEIVNNVV